MSVFHKADLFQNTRRHFFRDCGVGLGGIALSSLMAKAAPAAATLPTAARPAHFEP